MSSSSIHIQRRTKLRQGFCRQVHLHLQSHLEEFQAGLHGILHLENLWGLQETQLFLGDKQYIKIGKGIFHLLRPILIPIWSSIVTKKNPESQISQIFLDRIDFFFTKQTTSVWSSSICSVATICCGSDLAKMLVLCGYTFC